MDFNFGHDIGQGREPVMIPGEDIGVNTSERKNGTERTKKRKKHELVFFHRVATTHDLNAILFLPSSENTVRCTAV